MHGGKDTSPAVTLEITERCCSCCRVCVLVMLLGCCCAAAVAGCAQPSCAQRPQMRLLGPMRCTHTTRRKELISLLMVCVRCRKMWGPLTELQVLYDEMDA